MSQAPTPFPFVVGAAELDRYADWLCGVGVERGLLGPRETARIWDRHILNCAVVESAIPADSVVADVGSGAGLPGLVLALVRPDLSVHLIEPMVRRTAFLDEVVADLDLGRRVTVHRARAEELAGKVQAHVVTARAVVSLERLVPLCVPLMKNGGEILAIKGARAGTEIESAREVLGQFGFAPPEILTLGVGAIATPTTVIRLSRTTSH